MSYIGILEYVIGVIHDKDIWYYVGDKDSNGKRLRSDERYSSFLVDAKRYDDEAVIHHPYPHHQRKNDKCYPRINA